MNEKQNAVRQMIYREFTNAWYEHVKQYPYTGDLSEPPAMDKRFPVVYQNEEMNLEAGETRPEAWACVSVESVFYSPYTMGSPKKQRFQRVGQIYIKLLYRVNTGLKLSDELVNMTLKVFEGKTIEGVRIFNMTPSEQGPVGEWFLTTVQGAYQYFERPLGD